VTNAIDPLVVALTIENRVEAVIWVLLLGVKVFALCDALVRKDAFYVAADKQNKAFWLLLLVVFLVLHILLEDPRHILNLIGTVAAFVYLADVRPLLRSMHSR
jgi:magnesium-transporting ATPase (P-type)